MWEVNKKWETSRESSQKSDLFVRKYIFAETSSPAHSHGDGRVSSSCPSLTCRPHRIKFSNRLKIALGGSKAATCSETSQEKLWQRPTHVEDNPKWQPVEVEVKGRHKVLRKLGHLLPNKPVYVKSQPSGGNDQEPSTRHRSQAAKRAHAYSEEAKDRREDPDFEGL